MTFAEDMTEFADAARRFAHAMERFEGARLRHMAAQMDAASAAIESALGDEPSVAPVEIRDATPAEAAVIQDATQDWVDRATVDRSPRPAESHADEGISLGYMNHGKWQAGPPEVAYVSPTAPGEPTELSQTPPWERPAEPTSEPAKEGGRRTNEQIAAEHGVRLDAVKAWKAANSIGTNRVKAEEIKAYAIAVRQGAVPGAGPLASQPPAPVAAPQEQSIDDFAVDLDAAPVDGGTPPQTWQPPF